jgi:hypothetical protein
MTKEIKQILEKIFEKSPQLKKDQGCYYQQDGK